MTQELPVDSLEELARVFDEAFSSTDPRIKEGLSKLMVTMALLREHNPERPHREVGPMEAMIRSMQEMRSRMHVLEKQVEQLHRDMHPRSYSTSGTGYSMDQLRSYQWNWKDINSTFSPSDWDAVYGKKNTK
jgi:hypothetical protein